MLQYRYELYLRGGISRRIANMLNILMDWYYHCQIPCPLNLKGVFLCHNGFGIVINSKAVIGEGTYIQHGVTIGARDDIRNPNAPRIGQNCYIGAKATVIGDITIGDNVKIGANAVVCKDIPSNCTVVGVPARIIKK